MKHLVIGAVAAVAMSAGSAFAADLPPRPPLYKARPPIVSTWTGCYVGANVGVGHSHTYVNDEAAPFGPIATLDDTTAVGGGQIGCDYQFSGNWVFGAQAMFDGAGFRASATSPVLAPATLNGRIPWFATATARLGYVTVPNVLLYVKGGGAWTHTDANLTVGGVQIDAVSFGKFGWTVGGGVEWKLSGGWSMFAEYNYLRFNDKVVTFPNTNNIGNVHQDVQVGLVGVNYRFAEGALFGRY
jgi:outer membrane immunogenic protein